MNDILSEEQQQIESIKNWVKEHALSLVAAAVVFCAIVFGPNLYQSHKNSKIFPASDAYEQFNLALVQASSGAVATDSELALVDGLVDALVRDHADTQYAFLASLRAAKLSADLGNYPAALTRLTWASENTMNEADEQMVNYRLALIQAQLGETELALDLLGDSNEHFASLYAEARGDIYKTSGKRDEAILAYRKALETADESNPNQSAAIELKLNNLLQGLGSISE